MAEHRVSMLGTSWRRFEDPTRSRDPRIRALVTSLGTLELPAPTAEFRAELRMQLVAITPRIVADTTVEPASTRGLLHRPSPTPHSAREQARPRHSDTAFARIRRIRIGRPLTVAASVITAFAMLFGGAVWLSRSALPGDTLYGLKRASESFQLATAGSSTEKAQYYLDFAATRAAEARALLGQSSSSGPALDPNTASLISSTLSSADADVRAASTLLSVQALQSKSSSPLDVLTSWAPGQLLRLDSLAAAMPSGPLQARANSSADLVSAALGRAKALAPDVGCGCISVLPSDQLGPLPPSQSGGAGSSPTVPGSTTSGAPGIPGSLPTGLLPTGVLPGRIGLPGGNGGGAATAGGGTNPGNTVPPASSQQPVVVPLPTLPLPTPTLQLPKPPTSLPISVNSCGVGASLGPIGVGVSLCSSLHISLNK